MRGPRALRSFRQASATAQNLSAWLRALRSAQGLKTDGLEKLTAVNKAVGAQVFAWPRGLCTEQCLANDLPEAAIPQMATVADERGGRSVREALADQLGAPRASLKEGDPASWIFAKGVAAFRTAFGDLAKKKNQAWFKSRDQGAFLGRLIAEHWSAIPNTPTHKAIGKLRDFAHG